MARATWLLGTTTVAGIALAFWLYTDNRALRAQLAHRPPPVAVAAATSPTLASAAPGAPAARSATIARVAPRPPSLPETPPETRMDRRARRTEELAQMFGRLEGESEEDYRSRVMPLI